MTAAAAAPDDLPAARSPELVQQLEWLDRMARVTVNIATAIETDTRDVTDSAGWSAMARREGSVGAGAVAIGLARSLRRTLAFRKRLIEDAENPKGRSEAAPSGAKARAMDRLPDARDEAADQAEDDADDEAYESLSDRPDWDAPETVGEHDRGELTPEFLALPFDQQLAVLARPAGLVSRRTVRLLPMTPARRDAFLQPDLGAVRRALGLPDPGEPRRRPPARPPPKRDG